jgi:hypothetical protein
MKNVHFLWLAGGVLLASALFAMRQAPKPTQPNTEASRAAERTAELESHIARLEGQISQLKNNNIQQLAVIPPAQTAPSDITAAAPKPQAHDAPELTEERLTEQVAQRINQRYATLEQRFSEESVNSSATAAQEQSVRKSIQGLQGYALTKIECRDTMCRIEVKSDSTSAAGMLSRLGLTEGGEVRRREDGTFLIFAGREGFPFQEFNRVE